MSDDNQAQSRKTVSMTLIVLLLLAVSALGWYTFKLQQQLEQINTQQAAIQSQMQTQLQTQPQAITPIPAPAPTPERKPEPAPAPQTSNNDNAVAEPDDSVKVLSTAEQQPSESQNDLQVPSSAQGQGQGQGENATPGDRAPLSNNDYYRRPFAAPRWDPYAEIERMQRDMDRMLDRQLRQFNNDPYFQRHFRQSTSTPQINVQDNEHQYMVFVNLPGNDEKDVSVTLDGQRLTITGKQDYKQQKRDQTGNVIFQERRSGRFQRSITLPEPVYQNEMKTRLDNGVLKIKIPKVDISQRRSPA